MEGTSFHPLLDVISARRQNIVQVRRYDTDSGHLTDQSVSIRDTVDVSLWPV